MEIMATRGTSMVLVSTDHHDSVIYTVIRDWMDEPPHPATAPPRRTHHLRG